jgi:hypothetical protein
MFDKFDLPNAIESALQNSSRRPSQPEILMARSESRMVAVDERHQRP